MANAAFCEPQQVRDWLTRRRVGIGSSDAAAVCGVDPYKTPLEVYCDKIDDREPSGELPSEPAMRWGLLLESAVARGYELETGYTLLDPEPAIHDEYPWMGATADRIRDDGRIVELKTASSRAIGWGESGDPDGIPERVAVQVAHQLAVYGRTHADVAVLIDGRDFRIYPVERNDTLIESLIVIESDFWQRVVNRDPPEPDFTHPATVQLLGRIHKPTGPEVSLPDECAELARLYIECGSDIKAAESDRDKAKARIIHAMQDAARAHVAGFTISRKEIERKAYEVKASKYVSFNVKSPKGE